MTEEIKRLSDAATPGPWTVCAYDDGNPKYGIPPCRWTWINEVQGGAAGRMTIADAEYIVALVNWHRGITP